MSKSTAAATRPALVAEFTATQIAAAVASTALPDELQGVDVWHGSRDIGGTPAAHLAALNGKGKAIALCQCFADYHFGAESRANILKGINSSKVRKAFDAATHNYIRVTGRPLDAVDVLEFLKGFVNASMSAAMITPEKLEAKAAKAIENKDKTTSTSTSERSDKDKTTSTSTSERSDNDKEEAGHKVDASDNRAEIIKAQSVTIEQLQAQLAETQSALAAAQEMITAVKAAKTIKAVNALLAA